MKIFFIVMGDCFCIWLGAWGWPKVRAWYNGAYQEAQHLRDRARAFETSLREKL